MPPEEESTLSY